MNILTTQTCCLLIGYRVSYSNLWQLIVRVYCNCYGQLICFMFTQQSGMSIATISIPLSTWPVTARDMWSKDDRPHKGIG